ncbi:MAG: DNA-binding domain-containing protein [Parachlamydia sp.]|jgi:hypothetical protein|nr:DNA-binding domain-containing protein [Parachlamydia sp.]
MTQKTPKNNSFTYPVDIIQEWFGEVISGPLIKNDKISPISPGGALIAEESGRYIACNSRLAPYQRIEIYNQQYWWRLAKTLHTNFPLVTRLFGYRAFNEEIGVPFLKSHPPDHWSINLIGKKLPQWIESHYKKTDLPLIQQAAALDWAFTASYIAPSYPPLDLKQLLKDPDKLLSEIFHIQPHVHLFEWDCNLLNFREELLKQEVEYWTDHAFPPLKKGNCRFILYRTIDNLQAWREVSQGEYLFLHLFKGGSSVANACDAIESQDDGLYEEVAANLTKIIETWVRLGWLTLQVRN